VPEKIKENHEFLDNQCASCAGEMLIETDDVQMPCGVLQGVPLLSLLVYIGLIPVIEHFKRIKYRI
jgi:hypothetical protein